MLGLRELFTVRSGGCRYHRLIQLLFESNLSLCKTWGQGQTEIAKNQKEQNALIILEQFCLFNYFFIKRYKECSNKNT